eukprot:3951564-Prymnesium_polylepis.1
MRAVSTRVRDAQSESDTHAAPSRAELDKGRRRLANVHALTSVIAGGRHGSAPACFCELRSMSRTRHAKHDVSPMQCDRARRRAARGGSWLSAVSLPTGDCGTGTLSPLSTLCNESGPVLCDGLCTSWDLT